MDERLIKMITLIQDKQKSGCAKVTFQIYHEAPLPTIIIKDCPHTVIVELVKQNYCLSMGEKGLVVTDLQSKEDRL